MTVDKILYDFKDLINLIKENTALIVNEKPEDLFVLINKNKDTKVTVVRKDGKKMKVNT